MDPLNEETEKNKENIIDSKVKEAINDELTAFMNPKIGKNQSNNTLSSSSFSSNQNPENFGNVLDKLNENKDIISENQKRPIIRTYKSDVEETIQAGHLSSINMAISQSNRMMKGLETATIEEKKKKINKNILIISLVLIIGGALAILVPYFLVQKENSPKTAPPSSVPSGAIMTADTEEKINIKDINLNRVSTTLKERVEQSSITLGQIKNIFLTEGEGTNEKVITSDKFLTLIKADLPPEIERTLKPKYMFGMYNFNGNQEFLILKVGSYDTTFSGMLAWETDLWNNFKELFDLQSRESIIPTNSSATTTQNINKQSSSTIPATNNNLFIGNKKFQDATFFNKDCRVVKDDSGKIILLYSIIDENTVVITTSTNTLKEILARVSKARIITQ